MSKNTIMDYDTVALDDAKSALVIIDQTKLPYSTEILELTDLKEIWDAIYLLQVRGAPAIGVAAAIAGPFHSQMPSASENQASGEQCSAMEKP